MRQHMIQLRHRNRAAELDILAATITAAAPLHSRLHPLPLMIHGWQP